MCFCGKNWQQKRFCWISWDVNDDISSSLNGDDDDDNNHHVVDAIVPAFDNRGLQRDNDRQTLYL